MDWSPFAYSGVSAASDIFGGLLQQNFNRSNMALQNRYAQENMALSDKYNRAFQNFVWKNEIPENVSAMKRAGLNPAGSQYQLAGAGNVGNNLNASSPSSSTPSFDLLSGMAAFENARGLKLDNDKKEIELNDMRNFRGETDRETEDYVVTPEGEVLRGHEIEGYRKSIQALNKVRTKMGLPTEELPELQHIQGDSYGAMKAREFRAQSYSNIARYNADRNKANLDNRIYLTQGERQSVVNALIDMPVQEIEKLRSEISSLKAKAGVDNFNVTEILPRQRDILQKQLDEMDYTQINSFLNMIKSEDATIDKILATLGFIFGRISR